MYKSNPPSNPPSKPPPFYYAIHIVLYDSAGGKRRSVIIRSLASVSERDMRNPPLPWKGPSYVLGFVFQKA